MENTCVDKRVIYKNNESVVVHDFFGKDTSVECRIKGLGTKNLYSNEIMSYIVEPLNPIGSYSSYIVSVERIEKCDTDLKSIKFVELIPHLTRFRETKYRIYFDALVEGKLSKGLYNPTTNITKVLHISCSDFKVDEGLSIEDMMTSATKVAIERCKDKFGVEPTIIGGDRCEGKTVEEPRYCTN